MPTSKNKLGSKPANPWPPPFSDPYSTVQSYVNTAAEEYGVDPRLLNAIIHSESSFNPEARSQTGAIGLMQIMPNTAKHLGIKDPLDPVENIRAGAKYVAQLMKRFNNNTDMVLAAYHEGPTKVAQLGRVPNRKATKKYIQNIMKHKDNPDMLRSMYVRSAKVDTQLTLENPVYKGEKYSLENPIHRNEKQDLRPMVEKAHPKRSTI